jgi:hypothetical protein
VAQVREVVEVGRREGQPTLHGRNTGQYCYAGSGRRCTRSMTRAPSAARSVWPGHDARPPWPDEGSPNHGSNRHPDPGPGSPVEVMLPP